MPHENPPPLEAQLPPHPQASPTEPRFADWSEDVPFWQPAWRDVLRHMGWRWLLLLPALGLLAIAAAGTLLNLRWFWFLWAIPLKLTLLIVALPITVAIQSVQRAVRSRTDPFCIHCGYSLLGLDDDQRCPECGRPYSFRLCEEYRRDPHWFIARWKARTLVPTVVPLDAGPVRRRKSRDGTA